jgi:transposase
VYVLNPGRLAVIYKSMKKTDKEDALKPAHVLEDFREERLPVVPAPGGRELKRRKLPAAYRREQGERNRALNRPRSLFLAQGIPTVVKRDLADGEDRREAIRALAGLEREEAEHLVACLELYERRLAALDGHMTAEAAGDKEMERLQTVPGVGPKTAFAFAAHVDAERFQSAGQVSNYLGLVPRVYISGDTERYGRITKRGNGYLRALLVQGAWAVTWSKRGGALRERYEYMTAVKGISRKKAIAAAARRLGELLYTLLKQGTEYEPRKCAVKRKEESSALARIALSA